jgi:hypothetical protein
MLALAAGILDAKEYQLQGSDGEMRRLPAANERTLRLQREIGKDQRFEKLITNFEN